MTEVIVFLIVGGVAILSAAFMLISANAVHSALFLVLNFISVGFFFLTLGAPFLALTQVAVYAGAIMVLFLFVIMMLGAEKTISDHRPMRWMPRAALVMALLFVVTVGIAIGSGEIDLTAPPANQPQVRVIHAADAPPVDVYLNNQLTIEGLEFRDASGYLTLPAGEYGITVFPAGADPATESPAILGQQTLQAGDYVTVVAVGADGAFQLAAVPGDPAPITEAGGEVLRLTFLNALPDSEPLALVEPLPEFAGGDNVIAADLVYAQASDTVYFEEAEDINLEVRRRLEFGEIEGEDGETSTALTNPGEVVFTYRQIDLDRDTNTLLVVAPEMLVTGERRVVAMQFAQDTHPTFGSPEHVAWQLFTNYLLPFEIVGVLLLAAIVGAVALTRDEILRERAQRRRVVRRPLVGSGAVYTAADVAARGMTAQNAAPSSDSEAEPAGD